MQSKSFTAPDIPQPPEFRLIEVLFFVLFCYDLFSLLQLFFLVSGSTFFGMRSFGVLQSSVSKPLQRV